MVLRSVGYQSVPLAGVPFDERSFTVPSEAGRVLGPDGKPLPGEYVAGWLKRGPTGVIGTNKSDAAETVRSLLADLAGGPGPEDVQLPRAGLLRLPAADASGAGESPLHPILAERSCRHVSYADWLKIEAAERELAARLGRGARVKLASRDELDKACGLR
jgi:ferredoxin--NADP+ reductase